MRVLLADPDRDFLSGYRILMEADGNAVETAFDGARVFNLLGSGKFDLAVLNERLPRIDHERMMRGLRSERIPVVTLLDCPVGLRHLRRKELSSAYLSFPFSPSELKSLTRSVLDKAASPIRLDCAGVEIRIERFRVRGAEINLTSDEIDILTRLSEHDAFLTRNQRVYAHSLNEKFAKPDGFPLSIAYQEKKGYRLVKRV